MHERLNLEHLEVNFSYRHMPDNLVPELVNLPSFTSLLARKSLIGIGPVQRYEISVNSYKIVKDKVIPVMRDLGLEPTLTGTLLQCRILTILGQ